MTKYTPSKWRLERDNYNKINIFLSLLLVWGFILLAMFLDYKGWIIN